MIITKIPFRIPLGGGGTDLPSYYSQFGGSLVTASINKYMYVSVNEPKTSDEIKVYYKFTETVNHTWEINHDIIRECLKLHNIDRPIEIGSMADIEAQTGMGSSSVFTVGLLLALNTLLKKPVSALDLAEQACDVEIYRVGKPIGKQDQYAASVGGINHLEINRFGNVIVLPLNLTEDTIFDLESRLMMFYTGQTRDANAILGSQGKEIKGNKTEFMHRIKEIGEKSKEALLNSNIDLFGRLLHEHWMTKKQFSNMSSELIDDWYQVALINGALGGKIMGAGGGGFILICAGREARKDIKTALVNRGLRYMDFRFEFSGAKVITNI